MGITAFSITLLDKVIADYKPKNVCELGAQNLYNTPNLPAPYADKYYVSKGIEYTSIDLNKENNCLVHDLSKPLPDELNNKFDLVTNFGTSEHVTDLYECYKNIHNLCKLNGIIISENPKTGNWPGHGFHYLDSNFYRQLADVCGYEILELGEHPAMGNYTDGWNIYCIYIKKKESFEIKKTQFKKLHYKS